MCFSWTFPDHDVECKEADNTCRAPGGDDTLHFA